MKRLIMVAAALGLMGAAPAPAFRIGVISAASGACAPPPPSAPAGEHAYFDLLGRHLDRPVLACPVVSFAEGAAALAAGRLDMAILDASSYAAVKSTVRAAMTVRSDGAPTRVPVVLLAAAGRNGDPQSLKGRTVAFGGSSAVALSLPRRVLAQQGYVGAFAPHEQLAANEVDALADLRAGTADAVVLNDAAWQRQCEDSSPKIQPCHDLHLVWRARPQADRAFAVRRDLPDPLRFRLLGAHVNMHLENRSAFDWAAAQLDARPADFEPAEARALEPARLQ